MKSKNGIIGFAIGDTLGVPVEFKTREELKENPVKDMIGYGTYKVPKGTWSDDTSMTLATMDSIIKEGKINTNDIADRFLSWFRNAEYTATGKVFDIGRTTIQSLAKYELKLDNAVNCGCNGEYDNGNGSLMRMLPVAYYIYYNKITDDRNIYNIVGNVSSITHSHSISVLGCYIYVRFVLELLNGKNKFQAYQNIQKLDYSYFYDYSVSTYYRILYRNINELKEDEIKSSGYIVDTLEATMWLFLNSDDYNTTVLKAVNLGNDTDTIGACVGGLAGIYYGIENIKDEWKNNLLRYNYIIELSNKFDEVISRME